MFVDVGARQEQRLIKDIWDAGHLALFALLSYSYFSRPGQARVSTTRKIVFTTIAGLLLGIAIEVSQLFVHREFSTDDIINDVIGGYLGLLSLGILDKQRTLSYRIIATVIFAVFLAVGLRNLEKHLFDEFNMRKQFPVLADFESRLEIERWDHKLADLKLSQKYVKSGLYSLEVAYLRGRYPNISLRHLRSDWSDYNKLVFSVYNPNHQELLFVVNVYDKQHIKNGRKYKDRFSRSVLFKPGWNNIEIPLQEIINAPGHRSMNIQQIKGVSIFTDRLEQPVTIYIDDVRLLYLFEK